ncbi:shikimate dehydrogenase [Buchnera aphidicola]|uniref:Shikimate dehydrogenase (NADP(+)) n=1 Tax=Buchnera aphidicola (Aphis gossypii) TaxID=98785 RepID=A0A5J6ZF29_9GAMM|nr:shikimate dehydrogenase [Buchnera aphidicola]QFQ32296.1 shikimate dehydrogenase [Buchnera aphidicola (Aphis gossypii)]UPT14819.1 shikimate dehydrogenase [Buchnera aphidicola (Aphis gossypii)]
MPKNKNFNYALFGNPVNHSRSPEIHDFFSKQTGILHIYEAINVPLDRFSLLVSDFFKNNISGANVTSPFKKEAYFFSDKLSERAQIAKSVNTLKKVDNQYVLGDNTDGIGLLSDLKRLKFIKKNFSVLILGAGGAVQGVLLSILSMGCSVYILNRTDLNALNLVNQFKKYGNIKIFKTNSFKKKYFDLVINGLSRNIQYENIFIPLNLFSSKTFFYDMNYGSDKTSFLNWCKKINAKYVSDGIGMLVFQAAHSFLEWHGIFPKIDYIINLLNQKSF